MAIATVGIIDQEWADLLKSWIAGDRYVDYYIEQQNYGANVPIESGDAEQIRAWYRYIDSITGLRIRETTNPDDADIYWAQVDDAFYEGEDGTVGTTALANDGVRDYFEVTYVDDEDSQGGTDLTTIMHEMGHTVGLHHPYGDGWNEAFTTDDTIMSYNFGREERKFKVSDENALKYLWGEAGTNYDAAAPVTPGPQPPTTPNDALVASLVSGAWLQPSEVSSDSNVTYYIDKNGTYRFVKSLQGKGKSGGASRAEASFIREFFAQIDAAIPASVTEVTSARKADIVIGSVYGKTKVNTAQAINLRKGTEAAWKDQGGNKLTAGEKGYIGYIIANSFGLDTTPEGYSTLDSVVGATNTGYYGLTVNDQAALAQLWAV